MTATEVGQTDVGTARRSQVPVRGVATLALLAASAPLGIDFYLASFPQMESDLQTEPTMVQLTLTGFLWGLALGQLFWGPVSDRLGRRGPLVVGCTVAALAAVSSALAPSIEVLVTARFVQALASGAAVVMSRAIIADIAKGFRAAGAMTLMMSITSITPVVAPSMGAFLSASLSWRWVLGAVAVVNVVQVVVVVFAIPETLPVERRRPRIEFSDLVVVGRRPMFQRYALVQFFQTGTMMGYVAASPFLYQDVVGVSAQMFGVLFGFNACFLVLAGVTNSRLARRRIHPARTIERALPVIVTASLGVLVLSILEVNWLIPVPIFFVVASSGFVFGNVATLVQEQSRPMVGSGSALFGATNFLAGGMITMFGGLAVHSAVPLGISMTVCSMGCLWAFRSARRYVKRHPEVERAFQSA